MKDRKHTARQIGRKGEVTMKARRVVLLLLGVVLSTSLGCMAIIHQRYHAPRYSPHARPFPRYYCYDCHAYEYFEPYYDFCVRYGFAFRWDDCRSCRSYYEKHYVKIRKRYPRKHVYKYKSDYRKDRRYRVPTDYDVWKKKNIKKKERTVKQKERGTEPSEKKKTIKKVKKKPRKKE